MTIRNAVREPPLIDEAMLADYPELAVLTLDLPDSDGEPMENEREVFQIHLILESLRHHWKNRTDYYIGGNMFVYYSAQQARQVIAEIGDPQEPRSAFRGPDVFVALDVDGSFRRQKWVVWEEGGHYPDVIFEFLSPSTCKADRTSKKELYERVFKTSEYFLYDPFNPSILEGFRLDDTGRYRPISTDPRGRLWSEKLLLWVTRWDGVYRDAPATWLRLYTADGQLVLTVNEAAQAQVQAAQAQVQAAQAQAQAAQAQVQAAQAQAQADRARAEAAEAEAERLRAELARLRGEKP